eukprot:TRINITY_DN33704_c0_g1_i2.p1 TRINITY_DN33704_c0_g1~~TRINITY_DN33704_c0_g1_i2.p1  ORF type:complete len:331 (+),score=92.53 TRINITY_DN33704_c0_g1_i2:117-1109(+)
MRRRERSEPGRGDGRQQLLRRCSGRLAASAIAAAGLVCGFTALTSGAATPSLRGAHHREAFVGGPPPTPRAAARLGLSAANEEAAFETSRLESESTDFGFGKVKFVFFGGLGVGAGIGFITALPRLLASAMQVAGAKPVESVLTDIVINLSVMGTMAYLTKQELDADAERDKVKAEAALLSSLKIWLRSPDTPSDTSLVKLSDVRSERARRARRPILLIGDAKFCQDCVDGAAQYDNVLETSDLLLVPVLNTEEGDDAIMKAAEGRNYVAMPCRASSGWEELCDQQLENVRAQGKDESAGQVIVIKTNGRVATRFLGAPNWAAVTGAPPP